MVKLLELSAELTKIFFIVVLLCVKCTKSNFKLIFYVSRLFYRPCIFRITYFMTYRALHILSQFHLSVDVFYSVPTNFYRLHCKSLGIRVLLKCIYYKCLVRIKASYKHCVVSGISKMCLQTLSSRNSSCFSILTELSRLLHVWVTTLQASDL